MDYEEMRFDSKRRRRLHHHVTLDRLPGPFCCLFKVPGIKQPGCEAHHTYHTSSHVKNAWILYIDSTISLHDLVSNYPQRKCCLLYLKILRVWLPILHVFQFNYLIFYLRSSILSAGWSVNQTSFWEQSTRNHILPVFNPLPAVISPNLSTKHYY